MRPIAAASFLALVATAPAQSPGYTDTPMLPGQPWHVHDSNRPHPPVVTPAPAAEKPTPAPSDAIVLFDGKDLSAFTGNDGKAGWVVKDGYIEVNGTGDIQSKREFGDFQLHIEWATPAEVKGDSQGRGNSGVFLFGRYEIQVLDSYNNVTYADGQAAAIYGQFPPLANACRKPGEWQTYDIVFVAPHFGSKGELVSPARVTVLHNGVLVHLDQPLLGQTAHRSLPTYEAHAAKGPIKLQDHGNPMHFRNIWVRELDLSTAKTAAEAKGDKK